jgi:hypothetical protein
VLIVCDMLKVELLVCEERQASAIFVTGVSVINALSSRGIFRNNLHQGIAQV